MKRLAAGCWRGEGGGELGAGGVIHRALRGRDGGEGVCVGVRGGCGRRAVGGGSRGGVEAGR